MPAWTPLRREHSRCFRLPRRSLPPEPGGRPRECGHGERTYGRRLDGICRAQTGSLEGPNGGRVVGAMDYASAQHGAPRHLISDQEGVCISEVFADLLHRRNVKPCFGAVGKHGAIAVTERVILMLKYGWLKRVPVIRDLDHMSQLLRDFEVYYNECRGHSRLGGAVPACIHRGEQWTKPLRSAKAVPAAIERCVFADARVTAYRLTAWSPGYRRVFPGAAGRLRLPPLDRVRTPKHVAGPPVSRGPRSCELSRSRQGVVPRPQDAQRRAPHGLEARGQGCPILT